MLNRQQAEQDVAHLVDAWVAAELRADVAFLEGLLTEDFIGIGPLGFMLTKTPWLDRHRSGDLKYSALTVDEVGVRAYDTTTLVTCRQTQQAAHRGASIPGEFRLTLAFVYQEGRWRLAGLQLSPIGQPFAPPAQQA